MRAAEQVFKKHYIKIMVDKANEDRRKAQLAKVQKAMDDGSYEKPGEPVDNADSWGRGSKMHEAKAEREKND